MTVSLMSPLAFDQKSFLAHRTIEGRAAILDDALDRTPAARRPAWFAGARVNADVVLKHAELAIGEPVIAQRRAAVLDRLRQHRLDAVDQPRGVFVWCAVAYGKRRGAPLRLQVGAMQRLADIDVAKPGDDALIEQCRFEARLFATTSRRQHRRIKGIAEWLPAAPPPKGGP